MAKPRMDLSAFVGKLLEEQDGDVLREGVRVLAQALMETEVTALVGAERHERSDDRTAYRNGTRTRTLGHARRDGRPGDSRRCGPGTYFPSLLQPRRRAEQALLAVVQEAYVHGVSTRKVDDLVKALGLDGMSKSEVSRICGELDPVVEAFRTRPLTGEHPYVWLDATYHKVRDRRPGGEPGDGGRHRRDPRGRAADPGRGCRRVGGSRLLDGVSAESGEARAAPACAW